MRLCLKATLTAVVLCSLSVACATSAPGTQRATSGEWMPLFNGRDLTGWDTYLGPKLDANGEKLPDTATGLNNDPEHVFTVAEMDGGPVIRISGAIGGGISTVDSFENYHLRLQVKWGPGNPWKRARPDSGVLYHAGGEHGVDADYWMRSFEYQVMPDAHADLITIEGCVADVPTAPTATEGRYAYDPNGQMRTVSRVTELAAFGRVDRLPAFEDPESDWITLEIYTVGQTAVHVVDGQVVLALYNTRLHENGTTSPLTSGKIQIQSEGSEVFYRNIELRQITELPSGLLDSVEMTRAQ